MPDPITRLRHQWVAIEITPIEVFHKADGSITTLVDDTGETEIRFGCLLCDATPETDWHTICEGGE